MCTIVQWIDDKKRDAIDLRAVKSVLVMVLGYVDIQVFHRTPAYEDGSLCPGDELVSVNGHSLKGFSRKQTADLIQGEKVSKRYVFESSVYCQLTQEVISTWEEPT